MFHDDIERELGRCGQYAELTDLGAKIAEQAARIACVLHVFEHGPFGEITEATMDAAIRIAAWHLEEARRVFGLIEVDQTTEDAKLLLDWLTAQSQPPTLGRIAQFAPHRLRGKTRREQALDKLIDHALVRREKQNGSTVIAVNPQWSSVS